MEVFSISFFVSLLIAAAVIFVIVKVMELIPLPEQIKIIGYVIIGLVFILWLLKQLGLYSGF